MKKDNQLKNINQFKKYLHIHKVIHKTLILYRASEMGILFKELISINFKSLIVCLNLSEVTILLSQTVFSLLVANHITKTSEAVPLLGTNILAVRINLCC